MPQLKHILSPFKFLEPFNYSDSDHFFGRDNQIRDLVRKTTNSSIVVLFGPSGSGKTSLINSGFSKALGLAQRQLLVVRRVDNYIQSIERHCFNRDDGKITLLLARIHDTLNSIQSLDLKLSSISNSYRKDRDSQRIGKIDDEEYQRRIDVFKEKKSAIKYEINKKKEDVTALEELVRAALGLYQTSMMHYLILDQFEELLIFGSEKEAEQVGIFLSLINRAGLPIKVIIAIREEFLGELDFLEKHIPGIFHHRIKIGHPNENSVREILQKSFKTFNINQITTDLEMASSVPLPEKEMKDRIDEIINQLVSVDGNVGTLHFNTKEFYLPFLQIYLDRLYKVDFNRTYTSSKYQENSGFLPVEFEVREIQEFGSIHKVLEDYMDRINESIKQEANFNRLMALRRCSSPVIKVLKFLATPNFTKRTDVKFKKKNDAISLVDKSVSKKLQLSLWFESNDLNEDALNFLLGQLERFRLIKVNDDSLELSHDILARIMSSIPISDDIPDILRRNFNDQYNLYNVHDSSNPESAYLSEYLLNKISQKDLEYIISEDDDEGKRKRNYYHSSKKYRQRKSRVRKRILSILFVALVLISGGFAISWFQASRAKIEAEDERQSSHYSGQIFRNVGSAYNVGKNDITSAYDTIRGSESWVWLKEFLLGSQDSRFKLREDYINDLESDFFKRPFFYHQIQAGLGNHVLATKSRVLKRDEILLFAQTRDSLLTLKVNLRERKDSVLYSTPNPVFAFKPFLMHEADYNVLCSDDSGIFNLNGKGEMHRLFTNRVAHEISEIEQLDSLRFVGISESRSGIILINLQDTSLMSIPLAISDIDNIETLQSNKFFISGYKPKNRSRWLYQYDIINNQIYKERELDIGNMIGDSKLFLQYNARNGYLYLSGGKVIYEIDKDLTISNPFPRITTGHEEGITSFDVRADEFLVGSVDRTASLYLDPKSEKPSFNEILLREFIGHTDAVLNVSFVETGNKEFDIVLTSGQDGSIKFWDISPIESASVKIEEAANINKIDFTRQKLFVAFQSRGGKSDGKKSEDQRKGYIRALNTHLLDDTIFYYRGYQNDEDRAYDLTSFAFDRSEIITGNSFDQHVTSAKYIGDSTSTFVLKLDNAIKDICIRDNDLVIITDDGALHTDRFRTGSDYISGQDIIFDTALTRTQINSADIHPHEPKVLMTSNNKNIYLWNVDNDLIDTLKFHNDKVRVAKFSESGDFFVSGSWDNTAVIWILDEAIDKYVPLVDQVIKAHISDIEDIDINGDSLIATASSDNTVQIHRLLIDDGKDGLEYSVVQSPSLMHHNYSVRAVTFGESDSIIYSADKKGYIKKWNWRDYRTVIDKRRYTRDKEN